jgi:hypothetical protein
VLGKEQALQLVLLKEVMAAAKERPDMVKVSTVLVLVGAAHRREQTCNFY